MEALRGAHCPGWPRGGTDVMVDIVKPTRKPHKEQTSVCICKENNQGVRLPRWTADGDKCLAHYTQGEGR